MSMHLSRLSRLWHLITALDFDPIYYALWTRWRGLDLAAQGCEEVGLSNDRAKAHAASGGPLLERVLNELAIPPGRRVVDLGSGKGGAAITLSRYFADVVGVELSPALVEIAKNNVRKLGITNVRFVCGDAARFEDLHRFDYLYMFNPFPQSVMIEVIRNLQESLITNERPTTVIYKNPVFEKELMTSGWCKKMELTFHDSRPFGIYCADFGEKTPA